ncbi:MAG: segregation/condensation protein A [Proteobacteria bacterium]|nr:segregation/condensation protein A [Pseudomonadota bacterium]
MSPEIDAPPDFETHEDAPRLMLALSGYEGPLDLMLDLARREKIDLSAISMLALAEQYLGFVAQAKALRLEIAADYLVMAAWLTWLKSRLLLPRAPDDTAPAGEELAEELAARLERLAAFRKLGDLLGNRLSEHGETQPRGLREVTLADHRPAWQVSLPELLVAYGQWRIGSVKPTYHLVTRKTLSIPEARALLERLVGESAQWLPLSLLASTLHETEDGAGVRSATASGLVAALELAREGRVALRQEAPFAPLYLKRVTGEGAP